MLKVPGRGNLSIGRPTRAAITVSLMAIAGIVALYCGLHGLGIALLVLALVIGLAFVLFVARRARIPRDSVLMLRMSGAIREGLPRSPLEQLRGGGFPTIQHLREALEAARTDPKVQAVVVEIGSLDGLAYAVAHEFHDLLTAVKAAGKRVVAILDGDQVHLRDYMVACGAGEIIINPDTAMMLLGLSMGSLFLKGALSKLEIEAQVVQWKEYKGAGEIFNREEMSPPLRESFEAVIRDWESILAQCVAASRRIEPEQAKELFSSGFMSARAAVQARLVDGVGYRDDLIDELDPQDKGRRFISLARYLRHLAYHRAPGRRPRIAMVTGVGPVITGEPMPGGDFISDETAAEIRRAALDSRVRAIVFRISSPGGSAVGSDLVWRAVEFARKRGKPVIASMGDVAASGGYYVAANADAIVAEPGTITGSIGVIYTKISLEHLLKRLGISFSFAKTTEKGDAMSMSRPLTQPELEQFNETAGELYANFTGKVAQGRKLTPERTEELARGRIWSGTAALSSGLVDALGGLSKAIEIAREKAGIEPGVAHDLISYPAPGALSMLRRTLAAGEMSMMSGARWEAGVAAQALGVPERWLPAMARLLARGGALLICPLFPM